jgi:hydroxymethylpyrimidine pyrophosphatase-like HAD family hydrolase
MAASVLQYDVRPDAAEDAFFSAYAWCLNPMLTLRQQMQHLTEEIDRYRAGGAPAWRMDEHRINLYLFTCAIACTLDDYLAERPWNLAALTRRIPSARRAAGIAEGLLNGPHAWRSGRARHPAREWRSRWTGCVDAACELLLGGNHTQYLTLARNLLSSSALAFDEDVLRRRMRIPEAFRCQDLTHHDVPAMVNLCLPLMPDKSRPIAMIGPRTAGAYFAPLAAAELRSLGYTHVNWVTVRPKNGFSPAESRAIRHSLPGNPHVLVIDDHPNSGHTLCLLFRALRELGVDSRNMLAVLPGHPSVPDWNLSDEVARGVRIRLLPPEDRYKARLLAGNSCGDSNSERNAQFAAQYGDGFQVRLKRLWTIDGGLVLAKSVGWGWLGYHAWHAARALEGFVPRPLSLRDGILFSEFVEGESLAARHADPAPLARTLGDYVSRRVRQLPLDEDPAFATPGYRWSGWDDLVATLARIHGPRFAPLKKRAIRRQLAEYRAPLPTLNDGRMKPADWISADGRLLKTDFEQHNFGGGEPDIVDPAWDLAAAIYEFQLDPEAEDTLLRAYAANTPDPAIRDRLLLYKILYATSAVRAAKYWMARRPGDSRRHDWNRQFIGARSFAAFHMARYCGRHLDPAPAVWDTKLCFLDLDGVLDWGLFGFPHTSACGIRALRLLRRNRFAVVLNTARCLHHVREYCRAYRLPGGAAELGSVFYDAVRDWEIPLIDAESALQIEKLRPELLALPGVLLDPENRYSIRAYRFRGDSMQPLAPPEVEDLLRRTGCHRLTYVQSPADTYIVQKATSKGTAVKAIKAYLGRPFEPVTAIGDSPQDVDMLRAAAIAYAPANASREVCRLAADGECRRTSRRLQAGLLEAVAEICLANGGNSDEAHWDAVPDASLLDRLLQVPDRPPLGRFCGALRWWGL